MINTQSAALPVWYAPLEKRLTAMADALTASLTGWRGTDAAVTPEDCGYAGGLATRAIQRAIDDVSAQGGGTAATMSAARSCCAPMCG